MQRYRPLSVLLAAAVAACSETDPPAGPSGPVVVSPPRVVAVAVTGIGAFHERGQTQQLSAIATLSNGFTEDRSAAATWASDNSGPGRPRAAATPTRGT